LGDKVLRLLLQLGLSRFNLLDRSRLGWPGPLRQVGRAQVQFKLVSQEVNELLCHLLLHLVQASMLLLTALDAENMSCGDPAFRAGNRVIIPDLEGIRHLFSNAAEQVGHIPKIAALIVLGDFIDAIDHQTLLAKGPSAVDQGQLLQSKIVTRLILQRDHPTLIDLQFSLRRQ